LGRIKLPSNLQTERNSLTMIIRQAISLLTPPSFSARSWRSSSSAGVWWSLSGKVGWPHACHWFAIA
jgi:hypothetical protein